MAEQPPSGDDHRSPEARPEVRASHDDRDRVVEVLRDAAGDGQLTASELDERVEAALTARTRSELAALTADLQGAAAREAKDLVTINQRFGDVERTGRWLVPKRMRIKATAGNVKLDFTQALISHGTLRIDIDLGIGADLLLLTRPDIVVETEDLIVRRGEVKIGDAGGHVPVALTVVITGQVRGGDVVARFPRRTFGQWVRREPHPYRPLSS
jgi:DUF1707 SHOCT-like domain